MEKQTLPNSTLILVFGILSIVTCCCSGIVGLIFGIVALVLANKAKQTYLQNPELYDGYNNVNTGRILAIIGIIINSISLLFAIFYFATYGWDGYIEMQEEIMREYGQ